MKILMVCLGNICRSPLAEGILKQKTSTLGLDWMIDSAGTGSWHIGEAPDPRSIAVARKNGIDISQQRARQFQGEDLDQFDWIYAMDQSNYRDILRLAYLADQEDKVEMILNVGNSSSNRSVPDPYWDDNGFDLVYKMLNEACDKIIEQLTMNTK